MIVFDASEARAGTYSSKIIANHDEFDTVPWLEEITGADVIVSPRSSPSLNVKTLPLHLRSGALLIQLKYGTDLVSSMGTRMNESLARMILCTDKQAQRVLLTVMELGSNRDGIAIVNKRKAGQGNRKVLYKSVVAALDRWTERGGVTSNLLRPGMVAEYLIDRETRLSTLELDKEIYPAKPRLYHQIDDPNDPLQEMILVRDWRVMIAALDGIGPKRINSLANTLIQHMIRATGANAIMWITGALGDNFKVPGWGPKTRASVRDALGLNEGEMITVSYIKEGEK